jgi:hypothetical protein
VFRLRKELAILLRKERIKKNLPDPKVDRR